MAAAAESAEKGAEKSAKSQNRGLLNWALGRALRLEDVVLRAFRFSHALPQESRPPRALLSPRIRHIALAHSRAKNYKRRVVLTEASGTPLVAENERPPCWSEERVLALCRALAAQPLDCRRALVLWRVYGLSPAEISAQLGVSISTVHKHVVGGLAGVLQHLQESGGTPRRVRSGAPPRTR